VESFHRSLTVGLSHFNVAVLADPHQFDEALSLVLYVYRSTFHSSIDDSPAFFTYGVDPRPPSDAVWTAFRAPGEALDGIERDRLKMLHLLRLELVARANARSRLLLEGRNAIRSDRVFRLHDLVLLRLRPDESASAPPEDYRELSKLRPKWSLPYRVVSVASQGKAATVRSCLTGVPFPVREVHLQNARFINRPLSDSQRASWAVELSKELASSVLDPDQRHQTVAEFFKDVEFGGVDDGEDATTRSPVLPPPRPERLIRRRSSAFLNAVRLAV